MLHILCTRRFFFVLVYMITIFFSFFNNVFCLAQAIFVFLIAYILSPANALNLNCLKFCHLALDPLYRSPNFKRVQIERICRWQLQCCLNDSVCLNRKLCRQRGKCWLPIFSPFQTVLRKRLFLSVLKLGIVWLNIIISHKVTYLYHMLVHPVVTQILLNTHTALLGCHLQISLCKSVHSFHSDLHKGLK